MANVNIDVAFTSSYPAQRLYRASNQVSYNVNEAGQLTLTLPTDFRRMTLLNLAIITSSVATLKAYAEQDKMILRLNRGGATIFGRIQSLAPTDVYAGAATAAGNRLWVFPADELYRCPVLLPGDVFALDFPNFDTNGVPAGDLNSDLSVYAVEN